MKSTNARMRVESWWRFGSDRVDVRVYGSNGNGTTQHPIGTQFQNLAGTEPIHVP